MYVYQHNHSELNIAIQASTINTHLLVVPTCT